MVPRIKLVQLSQQFVNIGCIMGAGGGGSSRVERGQMKCFYTFTKIVSFWTGRLGWGQAVKAP